jgi:lysozyme
MHSTYLDAIRAFEGYTPQAQWDYAQLSNGYGTRAKFAGEVIDKAEADRRFEAAVADARSVVERHAPALDEGTKAALTSLTYNAGNAWLKSGLGEAVRRGDLEEVRSIFQQYNKAGGEVLPGLVSRRAAEALWIGNPALAGADAAEVIASAGPAAVPASADTEMPLLEMAKGLAPGARESRVALTPSSGGSASAPTSDAAEPALVTSSSYSDIARMVRLDSGHDLITTRSERRDRDEAQKT